MSSKRKVPLPASSEHTKYYPLEIELPLGVYKGIGKIISVHAMLENVVSDLVFILMKVSHAEGRTAFAYRSASEQFKLVRRLLDLRGIAIPGSDLNALTDNITYCCEMRDQMAHGIWARKDGVLGLRLTKGVFESKEGSRSRAITPQGMAVPREYFEEARTLIKDTIKQVQNFTVLVKDALQASPEILYRAAYQSRDRKK
jgi:hypothetical protein